MTDYATPYIFTALEILTAAKLNGIESNISALFPYTAAGQIAYSSASNALAVINKPSVNSFLKMSSTGVPSYVAETQLKGALHAIGMKDFAPGGQSFSGGWADISGASLNLTLTVACTVIIWAVVTGYNATTGRSFYVRGVVNGTGDGGTIPLNGGQARNEALPYFYRATGVPAGTRTVKLQCQADSDPNVVERGRFVAAAFVE